jgi:hypothetical protein
MTTAIVSGALANKCGNGGNAWTRMQWVLGLRRLGFDVFFVEQIDRQACVDSSGLPVEFDSSRNAAYFKEVCGCFNLRDRAALISEEGRSVSGLSITALQEVARASEILINIGGHLTLNEIKLLPRTRVFFDDDPAHTQFWHADGVGKSRLEGHKHYFTVGLNIGAADCCVPTSGIHWRPLPPIVALDQWPECTPRPLGKFTTVASWRGAYGPIEREGQVFGQKAHEFRKFVGLPRQSAGSFEIALDIHPADHRDLALLQENGWRIVPACDVAADPQCYQRYVQASGCEFSVAQQIYVRTQCGWFSDRTACYLASGRPALVQDTGFSRTVPVGDGLVAFGTMSQAAAGAAKIMDDYEGHCRAARALAEEWFDARKVLTSVLEQSTE